MPYEVFLGRTPEKIYSKLTAKLRKAVNRCLAYLEVNPTHGPNVVKLKGQPACFRYQIGGWRILYKVDDSAKTIQVYEIRPRGDVYKH
jgi:mRNA interferase RelE/StbE